MGKFDIITSEANEKNSNGGSIIQRQVLAKYAIQKYKLEV